MEDKGSWRLAMDALRKNDTWYHCSMKENPFDVNDIQNDWFK